MHFSCIILEAFVITESGIFKCAFIIIFWTFYLKIFYLFIFLFVFYQAEQCEV